MVIIDISFVWERLFWDGGMIAPDREWCITNYNDFSDDKSEFS